jgi:uncharacterized protein YndB with AHSA1/START domain
MLPADLDFLFEYDVQLKPAPEVIGSGPDGIRVNFYVSSGKVTGPQLDGIFLPSGGDWMTIRDDGVGILDVRSTIDATPGLPGGTIFMTYHGVIDYGEGGFKKWEQLLKKLDSKPFGDEVLFDARSAPRFYTADQECVGFGQADVAKQTVHFEIYAVGPAEYRARLTNVLSDPPEKVFQALRSPEKLLQILPVDGGQIMPSGITFKEGDDFEITVPGDQQKTYTGHFVKVLPSALTLIFTWNADDLTESQVFIRVRDEYGQTVLSMAHSGFPDRDLRNKYLELWHLDRLTV